MSFPWRPCRATCLAIAAAFAFAASPGIAAAPVQASTTGELQAAISSGEPSIQIGADFELSSPVLVSQGKTIDLDLSGHKITTPLSARRSVSLVSASDEPPHPLAWGGAARVFASGRPTVDLRPRRGA